MKYVPIAKITTQDQLVGICLADGTLIFLSQNANRLLCCQEFKTAPRSISNSSGSSSRSSNKLPKNYNNSNYKDYYFYYSEFIHNKCK